jgi:NADH-quinone oxidoreductase subunit N
MNFEGEPQKRVVEPKSVMAVMIFSTIFLIGFGVYPDPLIKFVEFATPVIGLGIMP